MRGHVMNECEQATFYRAPGICPNLFHSLKHINALRAIKHDCDNPSCLETTYCDIMVTCKQ